MKSTGCVWAAAAAAFVALAAVPIASAGRYFSVGYRTPAALHGLDVLSQIGPLRVAEVRVAGAHQARALRDRPGIRFVRPTIRRTNTGAPPMPAAAATSTAEWQWSALHADLVPGWVQAAAANITIAIVDTGADVLAPCLAAKAPATWNVGTSSPSVRDTVGHGTFVASLAGGSNVDASGMSGFGGDARLMIVQANRGSAAFSDVDEAAGIVYAVDHGANIINLSLGGTATSPVERDAIDYATRRGVLLVAAAGNSGDQGSPATYPAALVRTSGLVVGASDSSGARASFSTTGSYVDVLAPGVGVLGALASGVAHATFTSALTPGSQGTYGLGTGTSFAAPEVAGAAALVWAANPKLDAAGVAATIEATAGSHGQWTRDSAFGTIDVAAAVERAAGGAPPTLTRPVVTAGPKAHAAKTRAATKKTKRERP